MPLELSPNRRHGIPRAYSFLFSKAAPFFQMSLMRRISCSFPLTPLGTPRPYARTQGHRTMDWWHDVDIGNFTVGSAENPDLFCYISARFLYNEDVRLKERYVEFNVDALRQGATKHLGSSHGKVACLTKFAEGGFNRVLS